MNGSNQMTNREWLATAKPTEWLNLAHWMYDAIGRMSDDAYSAIVEWLDEEHSEEGEQL